MLFHEYLLHNFEDDSVILKYKGNEYSFRYIINYYKSLKSALQNAGVVKGERIILLMENGLDAISLQLCCSEMGIIYIPVSPHEPVDRIKNIIEQYDPAIILVDNDKLEINFNSHFQVNNIAHPSSKTLTRLKQSKFITKSEPDDLYIISTSGTTGKPKGIVMTHKGTISFFTAIVNHCKLKKEDNVGSISPFQFDFSLLDLGLAWGSGCCLTIFPQTLAYKPKKLIAEINKNKVTQFNSVPTIWSAVVRFAYDFVDKFQLPYLRSVLYAGDKFPFQTMKKLFYKLPHLKIINCFGQSESIACSFYDIYSNSVDTNPSFGRGYPNSFLYIVDSNGKLIKEVGKIGELWLSNDSLFRMYWKDDRLTKERLIHDEFDPTNPRKLYKTGDLIYKNNEGEFFYHGRKDNQVKVNGNRVELDEIEYNLSKHEKIIDAAAILKNNEIIAFVSVLCDVIIDKESLRKYCREFMPIYMVPNEIIILKSTLPKTINGKTDKKKLIESLKLA